MTGLFRALREAMGDGDKMTYTLHYASADGPTDDSTWSVYREQYESGEGEVPIDGTQEYVSTHATEGEAYAEAHRLQQEV